MGFEWLAEGDEGGAPDEALEVLRHMACECAEARGELESVRESADMPEGMCEELAQRLGAVEREVRRRLRGGEPPA